MTKSQYKKIRYTSDMGFKTNAHGISVNSTNSLNHDSSARALDSQMAKLPTLRSQSSIKVNMMTGNLASNNAILNLDCDSITEMAEHLQVFQKYKF